MLCGWHVRDGEKGGDCVGNTKRGKGTKLMVLADGKGTPLGICVEAASPAEVKLLERTLDSVKVKRRRGKRRRPHKPERLIADRGYDSNPARALLVKREIEPIIPRRKTIEWRLIKTGASSEDTSVDGSSSGLTRGCKTSGAW